MATNNPKHYFQYSDEVTAALAQKQPILALESTVFTHGLPNPTSIETAISLEKICREQDVVPATIAIIKGKIKIGVSIDELTMLIADREVCKASTRDLPYIVSQRLNAGTTVAATLFCAAQCGIPVFATGGIGGVHRGDAQDISADMIELSRTPIAMICAGAKSILDIPKTLELLETLAVPVIGFNTTTFPAFYTHSSQHTLAVHVSDIAALTNLIRVHWDLNLTAGVLIANPIPKQDEIESSLVESAISQALNQASALQIHGKAITPFLLSSIAKLTEGSSVNANIQLLINNVKLGAQLAKAVRL